MATDLILSEYSTGSVPFNFLLSFSQIRLSLWGWVVKVKVKVLSVGSVCRAFQTVKESYLGSKLGVFLIFQMSLAKRISWIKYFPRAPVKTGLSLNVN